MSGNTLKVADVCPPMLNFHLSARMTRVTWLQIPGPPDFPVQCWNAGSGLRTRLTHTLNLLLLSYNLSRGFPMAILDGGRRKQTSSINFLPSCVHDAFTYYIHRSPKPLDLPLSDGTGKISTLKARVGVAWWHGLCKILAYGGADRQS